jgi:hypothetical protein
VRAAFDLIYALHTNTCSYLLDADGVCRRIGSPNGMIPAHVRKCIGAQFVACLDLDVAGGLIGELREGTMALFVQQDGEHMSLLRTSRITRVDERGVDTSRGVATSAPSLPPLARVPRTLIVAESVTVARSTYRAQPPPQLTKVRYQGEEASVTIVRPQRAINCQG